MTIIDFVKFSYKFCKISCRKATTQPPKGGKLFKIIFCVNNHFFAHYKTFFKIIINFAD